MKKINLGKKNVEVKWTRKDEIGQLVDEFNKMVSKLDASADALAKTEREFAWREMAKQIAHEIKNPLTPMKLSLQYLQKAIDNNALNVKELAANVSNTLVEQIDHLNFIAGEFSQFANIENTPKELINIDSAISGVVMLYESDSQIQISFSPMNEPHFVLSNKTHLNRIFTNLIQNAKQAASSQEIAKVSITETIENDKIIIHVSDNGSGIAENIRPKIFMPNFTTKSSGAGLGLAMTKRMVEYAGGKIWFNSIEGKETTFFIEFPLKNSSNALEMT